MVHRLISDVDLGIVSDTAKWEGFMEEYETLATNNDPIKCLKHLREYVTMANGIGEFTLQQMRQVV